MISLPDDTFLSTLVTAYLCAYLDVLLPRACSTTLHMHVRAFLQCPMYSTGLAAHWPYMSISPSVGLGISETSCRIEYLS